MKTKYYANKTTNLTDADIKENPWDLVENVPLLGQKCEFCDIYEVDVKSKEIISKLTLSDFINDGIDIIKRESKDNLSSGDWARIGSSGNWARIGSSGNSARIGSSGDSAQIGSSGDSARIGSSGNWARIGSSGDSARIGSSGNWAQIGSSGDWAQIGSSGDWAQIGSSGDWARIGSSGNWARIGSSGNSARIGSSGDSAQIGSSGDSARIGSSGDWARIGSSGDSAQIGSSGDSAQIGSSGNWARIGSSGDRAQIEATGEHSIAFACGNKSYIKANKDTWISLAEYDNDGNPCFALAAQIGNERYKDFQDNVLLDNNFYMLCHKQFIKVKPVDGYIMVLLSEKKTGELTIYKTQYFEDYKNGKSTTQYVAEKESITAHGETIKKAVADLEFKIMQTKNVSEHVKRVKESGYITPMDYRLLTGACESGTNRWLNDNGFTWDDKKTIAEVMELTRGVYGHERLVELLGV